MRLLRPLIFRKLGPCEYHTKAAPSRLVLRAPQPNTAFNSIFAIRRSTKSQLFAFSFDQERNAHSIASKRHAGRPQPYECAENEELTFSQGSPPHVQDAGRTTQPYEYAESEELTFSLHSLPHLEAFRVETVHRFQKNKVDPAGIPTAN
jgi:hypothetical protein